MPTILFTLRRNSDGAERVFEQTYDVINPVDIEYHWTEGNYGCDCNRDIFFRTAEGLTQEDAFRESFGHVPCGNVLYRLMSAYVKETGQRILGPEE